MKLFHPNLNYVTLILIFLGCNNDQYKAYQNIYQLSGKGGHYAKSGPYSMQSQNGSYRLESIPYNYVNVTLGDLCSGFTKVYNSSNDSMIYKIDRYFGPDNTFLSNDGTGVAYVNNFWRGSDYDSCSMNILEFYKNGVLKTEYTYFELLGIQPDDNEIFWLFNDDTKNKWLTNNNHYQIDDELYVIPRRTGKILIFDISKGKIKAQTDTNLYLNNLEFKTFPEGTIKFMTPQRIELLPNLSNGTPFRHALSQTLNLELISTDEDQNSNAYYFFINVKAKIDTLGYCMEYKVFTNEYVLIETSKNLKGRIGEFLFTSYFAIDSLPYCSDYWIYEDRFYVARKPQSLATSDYLQYQNEVCLIDSFKGNYIPKNLNDAFEELDKILDDSTKVLIKFGEESHFGLGLWLRNYWGLWGGGRLKCFFEKRNLYHPDFISSLIIATYRKRLLGKSFNQDSLILEYSKEEKEWNQK